MNSQHLDHKLDHQESKVLLVLDNKSEISINSDYYTRDHIVALIMFYKKRFIRNGFWTSLIFEKNKKLDCSQFQNR